MELIIGAIVIIVLLLVLGVPPMMIVLGILVLMELFFILMALFFIGSLIMLLMTKSTEARYLRIDQNENLGVGTHAVYWMNDREYNNTFPAEIMFVDKIYHKDKICKVRLWQSRKNPEKYILLDGYSILVIATGFPIFVTFAVGGLYGVGVLYRIFSGLA